MNGTYPTNTIPYLSLLCSSSLRVVSKNNYAIPTTNGSDKKITSLIPLMCWKNHSKIAHVKALWISLLQYRVVILKFALHVNVFFSFFCFHNTIFDVMGVLNFMSHLCMIVTSLSMHIDTFHIGTNRKSKSRGRSKTRSKSPGLSMRRC